MDNKTRRNNRKAQNLCVHCGKNPPDLGMISCINCNAKRNNQQKNWSKNNKDRTKLYYRRIKKKVLDKYGEKCNCCGESNFMFLTIDHINNDGNIDRFNSSVSSIGFYSKLLRENIREDLQVLCFNCNLRQKYKSEVFVLT